MSYLCYTISRLTGLKLFLARNNIVRAKLKVIMLSNFMYWLVIGLVFLNSVSGVMQYYKQPKWIDDIISKNLIEIKLFEISIILNIKF